MHMGVLGTGTVGSAIATRLIALGHDVMMGFRTAGNPKAAAWVAGTGGRGHAGTFAETAAFAAVVFNCTRGVSSLDALGAAGEKNLEGKIVVDVANVLPPSDRGGESLGEQIQKAFPLAKVVKTLNTVNCEVMTHPARLPAPHTVFLSGNDDGAKSTVRGLLESFGWTDVLDLGDISTARAAEGYMPLWLAAWKALGTLSFNIKVVR